MNILNRGVAISYCTRPNLSCLSSSLVLCANRQSRRDRRNNRLSRKTIYRAEDNKEVSLVSLDALSVYRNNQFSQNEVLGKSSLLS